MRVQNRICLYAIMHNYPTCTFNWGLHTVNEMSCPTYMKNPINDLTLPNCQVCRLRLEVMSVTTAGTPARSVSVGSLRYKGNVNAKAQSWGNRKSKRNWSERQLERNEVEHTNFKILLFCCLPHNLKVL